MKKILIAIFFFILILSPAIFAQNNVGIGISTPNPSAVLDISDSTRGILVPRMTSAERLAIPSPANGLLVYDITVGCFYYNKVSSGWQSLCQNGSTNIAQPKDQIVYGTDTGVTSSRWAFYDSVDGYSCIEFRYGTTEAMGMLDTITVGVRSSVLTWEDSIDRLYVGVIDPTVFGLEPYATLAFENKTVNASYAFFASINNYGWSVRNTQWNLPITTSFGNPGSILTDSLGNGQLSWSVNRGSTATYDTLTGLAGQTVNLANNTTAIIIAAGTINSLTINFPAGQNNDQIVVIFEQSVNDLQCLGSNTGALSGLTSITGGISRVFKNYNGNWY